MAVVASGAVQAAAELERPDPSSQQVRAVALMDVAACKVRFQLKLLWAM